MGTLGSEEMDITSREVLEELKCPVCYNYMTPPIPMCQNGHNVCKTCRQRINKCPTCRQQFSQSRCWRLENVIQKMKFRCQYYTEGCEFVGPAQVITSHEANCPHSPFNCPFSVVVTKTFCWSGHISGMWSHILDKHTALVLPEAGEFTFTVDYNGPEPLHRVLHVRGETFFLVCRLINMDLYCCVLYVGPQGRASWYKYWVAIAPNDDSGYVTGYLPTQSYFVNVETLFRNGVCAVFLYGLWNRCRRELSSNIISFNVEIQFN